MCTEMEKLDKLELLIRIVERYSPDIGLLKGRGTHNITLVMNPSYQKKLFFIEEFEKKMEHIKRFVHDHSDCLMIRQLGDTGFIYEVNLKK